jgi:1-acyl-sn-glycerol-3-phosphate acyltransferase
MFPEGTRRTKGLVKRWEARPRSGAARIALESGAPLVPAAVKGTDKLTRLGRLSVAFGAPVEIDDLRGQEIATAAHEATERLMAKIADLEASLS